MKKIEQRTLPVEIRAEGDSPKIVGHAARFNSTADIAGMFCERFVPGAFDDTLRNGDMVMVWNHNLDLVLGRMSAGTLRASEDSIGLAVENDPPDTAWGRDAVTSIRRGDVKGMSIRFVAEEETWDWKQNPPLRTISRASVIECSPTAFPAYEATDAQVRSAADVLAAAEKPPVQDAAGQAGPPAGGSGGEGCSVDLLRRSLSLRERELQ